MSRKPNIRLHLRLYLLLGMYMAHTLVKHHITTVSRKACLALGAWLFVFVVILLRNDTGGVIVPSSLECSLARLARFFFVDWRRRRPLFWLAALLKCIRLNDLKFPTAQSSQGVPIHSLLEISISITEGNNDDDVYITCYYLRRSFVISFHLSIMMCRLPHSAKIRKSVRIHKN